MENMSISNSEFFDSFNHLSKSIIISRDKKLYKICDRIINKLLNVLYIFSHYNEEYSYYIILKADNNIILNIPMPYISYINRIIRNRYKIKDHNKIYDVFDLTIKDKII